MNNFLENFNEYLNYFKIKQNILSIKTKIEKNKLSRILSGKQELTLSDMTLLSNGLGKNVDYFFNKIKFNNINVDNIADIAFHAGTPNKETEDLANTLFDLLEHVDLIISMNKRVISNLKEV